MGVRRIFREELYIPGAMTRRYCDHPDCIGAWNECVKRCISVLSVEEFTRWLGDQESVGEFEDRVCLGITRPYVVGGG